MKTSSPVRLYLALLHYPVRNKNGDTIAAAVTNLDLHDIARAARTYSAAGVYVLTPLEDQRRLVNRIVRHWTVGDGGRYNPRRAEAMRLIRVDRLLADARKDILRREKEPPAVVMTTAAVRDDQMTFDGLRQLMECRPVLLVFGTAWGLTEEFFCEEEGAVLTPLKGRNTYNHLSVRSAVSIILDRLLATDV